MKLALGLLLLATAACPANAQSYSIDWRTIDGGGGTSTGGVYSVSGTIGQPDAGTLSGGTYTLSGGFWGVFAAVQTAGGPYLSVVRSNDTVVVSWPLPASGWLLHTTTNFVAGGSVWAEIPAPYKTNGASLQFTEAAPLGEAGSSIGYIDRNGEGISAIEFPERGRRAVVLGTADREGRTVVVHGLGAFELRRAKQEA